MASMTDSHGLRYPYDVSASCLAYLCADRLVRRLSSMGCATGEPAVTSPTSGTVLPIAEVELQCLATALWSLDRPRFDQDLRHTAPGIEIQAPLPQATQRRDKLAVL